MIVYDNGNLTAEWPASDFGNVSIIPCPCGDIADLLPVTANRLCDEAQKMWATADVSLCQGLSFFLCDILTVYIYPGVVKRCSLMRIFQNLLHCACLDP